MILGFWREQNKQEQVTNLLPQLKHFTNCTRGGSSSLFLAQTLYIEDMINYHNKD
jgi:hypothetical protein